MPPGLPRPARLRQRSRPLHRLCDGVHKRARKCGDAACMPPGRAVYSAHPMSSPVATNGHAGPSPTGVAPPHSIEAEQAVLGAILQSDRTHYAYIIEEHLRTEDFYRERHRTIYESVLALYGSS